MAFLSELIVCAACLSVWVGLALVVVWLLCWLFGVDKIAETIERIGEFFGLDD